MRFSNINLNSFSFAAIDALRNIGNFCAIHFAFDQVPALFIFLFAG